MITGEDRSRGAEYAAGAGVLAAAAAFQYALHLFAGQGVALAALPLVVAAAAWLVGLRAAMLAALGGTAATAFVVVRSMWPVERGEWGGIAALVFSAAAAFLICAAFRLFRGRADTERGARTQAELRLQQTDRLQQLTAALLQTRTPAEVIATGLPELLHAAEASAGALALIGDDGDEWQIVQTLGYGELTGGSARRWSLESPSPFADAMRRRDLVVIEPKMATFDLPFDAQPGDLIVPLAVAGRAVGAVLLSIPDRRPDDDRRELLIPGGRYFAQSLERARGYETAERARSEAEALRVRADRELRERQKAEEALRLSEARYRALAVRTSRLYALSAGLSEAVSLSAVAKAIVRLGKVVVGASAGSVAMLTDGGTRFETLHADEHGSEAIDSQRRFPAAKGLCATAAAETQRPVFVGSFGEWQERYPQSASIAADGGYESSATLPLLVDGAVFGVLSFHFTVPVNFDEEYAAVLTSVAHHCAQALDRARLYETAERARSEAETANQSQDDFLSTISHELRTPLNAMLGWAAMLKSGAVDASRTQRAVEAIFNNATRQGRLIEELLDVSRIVAGRASLDPQDVDLGENLRGAVEAIMPLAASKEIEVKLEAATGISVFADPRRLEQVFSNLLSNAVKFTPAGGQIFVDVKTSDGAAQVRVMDSGSGIDPVFLPHVFERFRQADSAPTRTTGGLGLGLFISRQLVEAQGGTIRAESEGPGRGSAFTVTLPAATASPARHVSPSATGAEATQQQPMPALDGIDVLLVDDEPDAREVMAAALESCGATVICAASAPEALETLAHTDVDLLLSDIAMPDHDGYELIRNVRSMPSARLAALPAAAVTAHARDDERERALAAGFQMYLIKPVHPSALATAVAALATPRSA
jgi:signal transduction histidine kinase/ActR/RegA family two-component response regulator